MSNFSDKEYNLFKQIAQKSETALKSALAKTLTDIGYKVIHKDKYIVGIGTIPIALAAHMDTVFSIPPSEIYYDSTQSVMWSPYGLGADDRAGIYAILQILKTGLKPHVIFTCGEEEGGVGATALAKAGNPFPELNYIIELDRQGEKDCVFYDCDNLDFVEYISSFGFEEDWGTFTDISILCPAWGMAGVNLSVGYFNEHSKIEILNTDMLKATIQKVEKILLDTEGMRFFKYIPAKYPSYYYWLRDKVKPCDGCHENYLLDSMLPFEVNGKKKYYCDECIDDLGFCAVCGQPYDVSADSSLMGLCSTCQEKIHERI